MNQAIFWRLAWKEYRLQRAFWIAMAVLAVMLMLLVWEFNDLPLERACWLFYIALGTPVFYALGCASTTFAGEHDAATYEYQRSLPVTVVRVFWSKISFAVLSTLIMFGLLWLLAFAISGWMLPVDKNFYSAGYWLWGLEIWKLTMLAFAVAWLYVVWGVFFSLLIKRPLLAAVLSVTVASMGPYLIAGAMHVTFPRESLLPLHAFLGLTTLLALVDIWLGRRWFMEKVLPTFRLSLPMKIVWTRLTAKPKTLTDYMDRPKFWTMLGRLTWQHWRQSRWVGIVVLVMLSPLILIVLWMLSLWMLNYDLPKDPPDWVAYFMAIGLPLALTILPLIATFTFLGDQRQRNYRFFAERSIPPKLVWLSRLLPWLIIIVPGLILILISLFVFTKISNRTWNTPAEIYFGFSVFLYVIAFPVLSLCVGQLCSLFFRSGLLAGLFGLLLAAFFLGWAALMLFWRINWLWSVVPIPIVLLLATWLRAPDWILERNRLRTWLLHVSVVVVPVIALLIIVPLYRVHQIPLVEPGFSLEQFTRPLNAEEQATQDLYGEAYEKILRLPAPETDKTKNSSTTGNTEQEEDESVYYGLYDSIWPKSLSAKSIAYVEINKQVISLALEASKGQERIFAPSSTSITDMRISLRVEEISRLVYLSARKLVSDGKLDDAWEQYLALIRISKQLHSCGRGYSGDYLEGGVYVQLPFWATRPDQTAERIKKAIDQIEKLTSDMPAGETDLKLKYMRCKVELTGAQVFYDRNLHFPITLWLHLPWERVRALRLLNADTRHDLEAIYQAKIAVKEGGGISVQNFPWFNIQLEKRFGELLYSLSWPFYYDSSREYFIWQYASMENSRRATRIVLALQAYKLEHGGYPKTLDELAGTYLKQLPNDPYSGEPYRYYPEGMKEKLLGRGTDFDLVSPGKDKPFIWSTTEHIHVNPNYADFMNRYTIFDEKLARMGNKMPYRYPRSIYDILEHGRCFFVP